MILFLDFDGVLHPNCTFAIFDIPPMLVDAHEGSSLFMYAPLLEQTLSDFPDVKIVLSTNWARDFAKGFARDQLPPGLRIRVIGDIYSVGLRPRGYTRYQNVRTYIQHCNLGPLDWCAIDDDWQGWPDEVQGNLIACYNTDLGISHPDALANLRQVLGNAKTNA